MMTMFIFRCQPLPKKCWWWPLMACQNRIGFPVIGSVGWFWLAQQRKGAKDYIEGIKMLSNMRMCSNVPGQHAIQTSLGGYQSMNDLLKPGGRLYEQREIVCKRINAIPGLSCVQTQSRLLCLSLKLIPNYLILPAMFSLPSISWKKNMFWWFREPVLTTARIISELSFYPHRRSDRNHGSAGTVYGQLSAKIRLQERKNNEKTVSEK